MRFVLPSNFPQMPKVLPYLASPRRLLLPTAQILDPIQWVFPSAKELTKIQFRHLQIVPAPVL
jgi:hypothetical protein